MEAYGVTEKVDFFQLCLCAPLFACRAAREQKSRKAAGIVPTQQVVYAITAPQQQMMTMQQPAAAPAQQPVAAPAQQVPAQQPSPQV